MESCCHLHQVGNKTKNRMVRQMALLLILITCTFGITPEARMITGIVTASADGSPLPGVNVMVKGSTTRVATNAEGRYQITVNSENDVLIFSFVGFVTVEKKVGPHKTINVTMAEDVQALQEVVVTGYGERKALQGRVAGVTIRGARSKTHRYPMAAPMEDRVAHNTEEYEYINENIFHDARRNPLSTFSIDVDAASYSNIRRFINNGQRPPKDAVRIEEMVNYFRYTYAQPDGEHPFAIHTEVSNAPWNTKHKLVSIALQGKSIPVDNLPPSNLVFLIDVSGSMGDPGKLPLLKSSFKMLVGQLRPDDMVSIVVYAGAAGLVLEPTRGENKSRILDALERLEAGGSTAGGAGIQLAYSVAKGNFKAEGNNRVILATDGDFNVGASSNAELERMIEEKRKDGIFLTVLGFGMGNYKDSKMEKLADKGNGNYAYIDNLGEAKKVLVSEFGGTIFTIAKDVKLQVEFNPTKVKAYRLIGYENRMLNHEDFNDDKKDAGDLGSGHTVTALYEIIPEGVDSEFFRIDELKYQKQKPAKQGSYSDELLTVKFRYKAPQGTSSKLIVQPLKDNGIELSKTSENFRWAASVASFGMLLRDSPFAGGFTFDDVAQLAEGARGEDKEGYRAEFINMVQAFGMMSSR